MRNIASPGSVSGRWVDYDAVTNPLGTIFSAQWANDVQDEITGVILEARLPLVAGSKHKMTEAIKIIASETVPAAERWARCCRSSNGVG